MLDHGQEGTIDSSCVSTPPKPKSCTGSHSAAVQTVTATATYSSNVNLSLGVPLSTNSPYKSQFSKNANMSNSPRTPRKRTVHPETQPLRWTDEQRLKLRVLRQQLSHLNFTEFFQLVGPEFPGRSKSALTQECQKMERLNTERRLQCIKDRRQEHTTVSKPVKRPLGDHFEHLNRRSPKEPKLENHTAEESSDDGGDIEFSGERQPSFSRQSPTVPCSRENPLRSPTIVQSSGPQQQSKPNMQYRPKSYTSPNSAATPAPVKTAKSRPDVPPQDYPSQRRVAERTASSSSSADTQPRSPSITNPNHTVGTTKDPRSTPQTNGTRGTPENDVTRLTDSKHPAPSHPSLQLPPKPPTPLPTPQQTSLQQPITISQQSTSQEHTSQQPVHQQPFYQKPVHQQHPQQQPTTQQPLGPPGEPNKPYIEQLTGDQCLDGAVHLLARLTRIRVAEGMEQGERLNENAVLQQRISDLESRLEVQTEQLESGNTKLLAMEKELAETKMELLEIRKERKAEAKMINELGKALGLLGNAAKQFTTPGGQFLASSTGAAS